jgi:hypothetical protein
VTGYDTDAAWHIWHVVEHAPDSGQSARPFSRFLGIDWDPHRLIYGTIIVMVSLAIYDDSIDPLDQESIGELMVVVIAPLFALAAAHAFSDAIDIQVRTANRLTSKDRFHLLFVGLQYLAVGIPVIVVSAVVFAAGGNTQVAVDIAQGIGVGSLFVWGAFAARRAGLGRWVQFRYALVYGLLGFAVIVVELLLAH